MIVANGKLMVTPTKALIQELYSQGFSNDQFTEYFGIDTTSKEMRDIIRSRKSWRKLANERAKNLVKIKRYIKYSMEHLNEKVYSVYTTRDGRKELKVCYATSTAYLSTDGVLSEKFDNVTLEQMGRMVAELERYDNP